MSNLKALKAITAALSLATSSGLWAPASAEDVSGPASVVVLPFSVLGHDGAADLPRSPCDLSRNAPAHAANLDAAAASDLPATLAVAVARRLGTRVQATAQDVQAGSLIVAGCIQRADPGNPAERLVGLNMGASVLAAHVQLYRREPTQLRLVRAFDVQVTGVNKLPPIGPVGLAVHGVRDLHETLGADAVKLSRRIAEQVVAG